MKNKRVIWIFIIIAILILIAVIMTKNMLNKNQLASLTEITPKEEMTDEQERQTMITLYYTNTETNTLMPEARVIDAKKLLESPYKTLVEYLIEGPKNEKFKSSIPEETKINGINLNGDTIVIDLSKEFINEQDEEKINLAIYSIVNTLTELNEVDAIKILIDGEENIEVPNTNIKLSEKFERKST